MGLVHLSLLKLVFPASNFMSNKLLLICIPSAGQQMLGHLANEEMRWPLFRCILPKTSPPKKLLSHHILHIPVDNEGEMKITAL